MPDKEGDDEKSTKSVVSKKQKQMMGEEGYDIARDMGRVRPSKDKKDATTMPPSKEMEKTRKVYKGPSALDIVKKKYKGQIMDVGKKKVKEELDLTQVAEAFGGYIVEEPVSPKKPKKGSFAYSRELGPKGKYQTSNIVKRALQAFPPPGEGGKIGSTDDVEVEKQITAARQDKKAAQIVGRDKLLDTISNTSSKRSRPDITGGGGRNRPTVTGGGERQSDTRSSIELPRQMTGEPVQQTLPGFEKSKTETKPKRTYTRRQTPEQQAASNKKRQETRVQNVRAAKEKAGQKRIDFTPAERESKPKATDFEKQNPTFAQRFTKKPASVIGQTGGLLAKTLNPALAGTEAMQRYREGRKGDAAISAVQALGGPVGFGAGVVNYIRSKGAAAAATQAEPQSAPATSGGKSKESQPKTEKGGGDGKKPPKTPKQTPADGGEPSPTAGTIDTALSYQISRDALSNVKDILKSLRPPKVTKRTKTGRRSAGS